MTFTRINMPICCVFDCTTKTGKTTADGVPFHRFPKELSKIWGKSAHSKKLQSNKVLNPF